MQIVDPNYKRKSYIEIGDIVFWTATINNWNQLLKAENFKQIIIDSLINLTQRELVDVYAFVIMPNHIHLIWKTKKLRLGSCLHEPNSALVRVFTNLTIILFCYSSLIIYF